MASIISDYLNRISKEVAAGNATEHTHRSALQALIEALAPGITATNEPRRVACGAPDYVVTRAQTPLGYIEAKDVDKSLDEVERSEQMRRYLDSLGNLILTNYLEFRWYVRGKHRLTARLATLGADNKLRREREGEAQVAELLTAFLQEQALTVGTAKELAERMAGIARLIRDTIRAAFASEQTGDLVASPLHVQLDGFRSILIHDLTPEQFADMYAQTVCYGLFAARVNCPGDQPFTKQTAAYSLPRTNPFMRWLFNLIVGPGMDERIAWAVDDLAELLSHADMAAVLHDFGRRTGREDPMMHFYETFLHAYDPVIRELRGVYYTPAPVVSYIVRSVDHLLKSTFGCQDGLANAARGSSRASRQARETAESHRVLILDPACGTGTFLQAVIERIYEELSSSGQLGAWSGYVSEHLLPRLYGFELLMGSYAVAHLKLGLRLAELGYDFRSDERLRVYLTNTLEEPHEWAGLPLFTQELAREVQAANQVKSDFPIMVILGNPPYSGHSANKSWEIREGKRVRNFIGQLLNEYYYVDGQPLGERNPKWLQDDYVKFIRFAQWRIERTGYGILAFISNHGYLDNPTFRGMRQSLLGTFDEIYLLNLHGNSKKRERCPDGSADENVFDIQQGVAIGFFVKRGQNKKRGCSVRYADLWGLREVHREGGGEERELVGGKYHWLWAHDLATTQWQTVLPEKPFYLFVPQDTGLRAEYEQGWKVTEAMPVNNMGVTTGRDAFATSFSAQELRQRISELSSPVDGNEIRSRYRLEDSSSFQLEKARSWARTPEASDAIIPFDYRCFDRRYVIYSADILARSREELFANFRVQNEALVTFRAIRELPWFHVFVAKHVVAKEYVSSLDNCFVFPLYLYSAAEGSTGQHRMLDTSPWPTDDLGRVPNLNPRFVAEVEKRLGMRFLPHPRPLSEPERGDLKQRGSAPSPGSEGSELERGSRPPSPILERGMGGEVNHSWAAICTTPELWAKLKPLARQMRHEPTPAEGKLWQALRGRRLGGAKFRRQYAIDRFIVDFYCPAARLVVEVDGPVHDYQPEQDAIRQQFLESLGLRVLRFRNEDVLTALEAVLDEISVVLQELPHPQPLSEPERGDLERGSSSSSPGSARGKLEWSNSPSPDLRGELERGSSPRSPDLRGELERGGSSPSPDLERGPGGEVFSPEDIFHYIYAILHSPTYRARYAEFLKIDFPRLPLTSNVKLFRALCALGGELVALHLMESPTLDKLITRFPERGDNRVEQVRYVEPATQQPGRVYINQGQYFEGVPPEVWTFHVGGYQVLEKWLKDRKGRQLSFDDLLHYQKIVVALRETLRLMGEIDQSIEGQGGWPIE